MFANKIVTIPRLSSAVALRKQLRKFFGSCSTWKKYAFSLLQFYNAAKTGKKPSLKQTEQKELNSATNMATKIDIDTLKIQSTAWLNGWRHHFSADPDGMIWVHPHPGHIVAFLDKMVCDDILCLVASNKQKIQWARTWGNPPEH